MCSEATQALSVMTTVRLPTSVFLFVQIFSCYLVISTHGLCGPDEYPITGYPGGKCLHCEKCQEGQGLVPKCGTPIEYQEVDKIDCKPCQRGTFNDKYDSSSCHVCHHCVANEKVTKQCTPTSDTICSGTCEKGFYFSRKDGTHSCQKCSHCCLDGQDEEEAECKEQGDSESKQYCAPRPDKDCTPPYISPSTGGKHESDTSNDNKLSQTDKIIIIVVGTIFILAVVIVLAVTVCWCKRKRRATGDCQSNSAHPYAMNGPSVDSDIQQVTPRVRLRNIQEETVLQDVVTQVTSSQDEEIQSAPSLPQSDVSRDVTMVYNEQHGMSAYPVVGNEVRLPKSDRGGKNPLQRSLSRDSQRSGDDADKGGFRKRTSSTSSFSGTVNKTLRKLSTRGEQVLVDNIEENGNEIDGIQGPIVIKQDPKSQRVKAGSNVQFECKAQDAHSRLIYQWFKDGTPLHLPAKNDEAILRLKSVKMGDFGCYKCHVSCQDNPSVYVESDPGELDVTPGEGTRYKLLTELQEGGTGPQALKVVGILLSEKKHGLGGWREVAVKYGMDLISRKSIENEQNPGDATLEYIFGCNTNLTVYDFCQTLKGLKRFDAIKELLEHLSCPVSGP